MSPASTDNFRTNHAAGFDLQLNAAAVAAGGLAVGATAGMSTNDVTNDATSTSSTGLGTANDVISFSGMRVKTDSQQVSISTVDAQGALQSTSITLSGDASKTTTYAGNIDKAISNINAQLQGTGNASLMNITAVKELNNAGTAEGIRFISTDSSFSVKLGTATNNTTANPVGMYDGTAGATSTQNITVNSSTSGTMDISTAAGGQQAVTALGQAVTKLGSAQAAIGKGQNQLGLRDQSGQFPDRQLLLGAVADSRCGRRRGSGESEQGPGPAAGFDCCHGPGQFRSAGSALTPEGLTLTTNLERGRAIGLSRPKVSG